MDDAPLPGCSGKEVPDETDQPRSLVRGDEANSLQSALLEVAKKGCPASFILPGTEANAENVAVSFRVHSYGHEDGNALDLASPTHLEPNAVEEDVRMLPFDGTVAPLLDPAVDLLVQVADRPRTDALAPQRLGDAFDAAHRDARQVHLDERLLYGALAAAAAFDDRRFERQLAKLRDLEFHLSGFRLQLSLIVAGTAVHPVGAPFVALRAADVIRFGIEQPVQGLFNRGADHFPEVFFKDLSVRSGDLRHSRFQNFGRCGTILHDDNPPWVLAGVRYSKNTRCKGCRHLIQTFLRKILYVITSNGTC